MRGCPLCGEPIFVCVCPRCRECGELDFDCQCEPDEPHDEEEAELFEEFDPDPGPEA